MHWSWFALLCSKSWQTEHKLFFFFALPFKVEANDIKFHMLASLFKDFGQSADNCTIQWFIPNGLAVSLPVFWPFLPRGAHWAHRLHYHIRYCIHFLTLEKTKVKPELLNFLVHCWFWSLIYCWAKAKLNINLSCSITDKCVCSIIHVLSPWKKLFL